jgi:polar amino acid transport system substrate-binding protein
MKQRSSFLRSLSLLLLAVAACSPRATPSPDSTPQSASPLPASGYSRLRVGIATNYPPLAFEQDGKIRGIEADFARQLREDTRLDTKIVTRPWEDLIRALRAKEIDVIMSGMSVTDQRSALVSFARPYLRVGQMCLIRAEDISRLASPSVLFDEPWGVGVLKGTTGEAFAKGQLKRSRVVSFDSIEDGIAALHAKRIDYFIHDAPTIWRITTDPVYRDDALLGLFQPLTEEYLAWAVRQEDHTLRAFLDAVLARWKEDGTLQRVLDRWIRVRLELRPPDALQGESGRIP